MTTASPRGAARRVRLPRNLCVSALFSLLCACSVASPPPVRDALSVRLDASAAKAGAPDLHARAMRAFDAAANAETAEQTVAGRVLAEVWLDAAEAEAARIEVERKTTALFEELDAAETARINDERARRQVAAELLRRDAARLARAEAARAFEQAKLDEQGRRSGPEVDEARRRGAAALLARARLVLAAARALQAPDGGLQAATAAIELAAKRTRDHGARLATAHAALDLSMRALGVARAARPGPTPQELQSLQAAAADRGLRVHAVARGLLIDLGAAFRGRSARLTKGALAALTQVRSLLGAHPHGPVMVEAYAPPGGGGKLAARRAQHVVEALKQGDRARVAKGAAALSQDGQLVLVLTAYAR